MFQEKDCGDDERNILSTLQGMTLAECRLKWEQQYRLELLTRHIRQLISYSVSADSSRRCCFVLTYFEPDDILPCDGVSLSGIDDKSPTLYMTIEFVPEELSRDALEAISNQLTRRSVF